MSLLALLTTSGLTLALHGVALADGGNGGGIGGGVGGSGYAGMAGGNAGIEAPNNHGGGGGGGAGGGLGGLGGPGGNAPNTGAGGKGGDGGLNNQNGAAAGDGTAGAVGDDSSGMGSGGGSGGGGGAGGAGYYYLGTINDLSGVGAILGGKGGNGGKGFPRGGAGGKGGDGGGGVVMADGNSVTVNVASVTGGVGGRGGDGANIGNPGVAGHGGRGGAGVIAGAGGSVTVTSGTITGGNGGAGGTGGAGTPGAGGNGGAGGAGIAVAGIGNITVGAGTTVIGGNGGAAGTGNAGSPVTGIGGFGIQIAGGGRTVTVAGTVTGGMNGTSSVQANAIDLAGGGNSLILENGYLFNGKVVSAGGDGLALGGDSDGSFDLSLIGSTFMNFGTFGKVGDGTWTLTGTSSFSGETTVTSGTLVVNGQLASSPITVESGGILGGTGTVGATTVESGGIIAPGDSLGTLNVNGALILATGSTYRLDVVPDGSSDRIAVTGGAAIDGTLVVASTPGASLSPLTPSEYTILTATGGVTGTFAILDTSVFAFFDGELDYDTANEVNLTLSRNGVTMVALAEGENQKNVAAAVEALDIDDPLYADILRLSGDDARSAFEQLSGEGLGSVGAVQSQVSGLVSTAAVDRIDQVFDALDEGVASGYMPVPSSAVDYSRSMWISVYGARSDVAADAQNAASATDAGGVTFGLDGDLGDWTVGLMGGYGRSASDVAALDTSIGSIDYSAGVYAGTEWDSVRVALGAVFTYSTVDSSRSITLPTAQTLTADFATGTGTIFGEASREFDFGAVSLTPFAGLQYLRSTADAYSEQGGMAALSVAARADDALYTTIGLRSSADFVVGGDMLLSLGAGAGWKHAFAGPSTVTSSFVAGGNSFAVSSAALPADRLALEASAGLDVSASLVLDLGYTGELASNAQTHQVQAGLKGSF